MIRRWFILLALLAWVVPVVPVVAGELEIADGVVVKFGAAGELIVRDGLKINGDVLFTSAAATPAPGDWLGVLLERSAPQGMTDLAGLRLRFGGNGRPAFRLRRTTIALGGFAVQDSAGVGLGVGVGTSSVLSQLVLSDNLVGFQADSNSTVSLSGSFISGNATLGAQNLDPSNPLTISSTWWGHPSGPLDTSDDTGSGGLFNPGGMGNPVTDGILYDPASQLIPLIGATIEPLGGSLALDPDVTFRLRSLTAVATKLSENNTFPVEAFEPLLPTADFTLSAGDGMKTVYARFQAATGNTMDVSTVLTLDASPPMVALINPIPGDVIGRPITVTADASDGAGIDRVEFLINGVLAFTDTTNSFSFDWDVRGIPDGPYVVSAVAFDLLGNAQRVDVSVTVSVLPPPPPVISSPSNGGLFAVETLIVSGTADPLATVNLFVNVIQVGQTTADGIGDWSLPDIQFAEGASTITARATDPGGTSQSSAAVAVTIDTGPPGEPLFFQLTELDDGLKRFDWLPPLDFDVESYNLYRATSMFTTTAGATQIQTGLVLLDTDDTPTPDGMYYYGATAVDVAGNEGILSDVLLVVADTVAPTGAIVFAPISPVGVGTIGLTLVTSEAAASEPFVSITPAGGAPIIVVLTAGGDAFTWTGMFDVASDTPTGTAAVTFSARDAAQNLGSMLTAGATIDIDTAGPQGMIAITPLQPAYGPGDFTVDLTLDEPSVANPVLRFAPPTGGPFAIALTGAGTAWQGTLTIEPSHGDGAAGFELDADDALGNITSGVIAGAEITLDVTPPPAPAGLIATAVAAGEIQVDWDSADGAATYDLRRAPAGGGIDPMSAPLVSGIVATLSVDLPPADGAFEYAATAVDLAGNESPLSNIDSATSDRTPPGDPTNLLSVIENDGIRHTWTADAGAPADRFALYRSESSIVTLTGLTPIKPALLMPTAFDRPPFDSDWFYALRALDAVGNTSNFITSGPITFDQAPPMITITGVSDDQFSNSALTIGFTADDMNLDTLTAELNGQSFTSGSMVAVEGAYVLVVDAADTSGNESSATVSFVIDLTPPMITITGVSEGQTANMPLTPFVQIIEDNPGSDTTTLNGAPFVSGTTVSDDDAYTLIVDATDAAGNNAIAQVMFTLDSPPSPVADLVLTILDGGVPQLSWTASTAADVVGYDVRRDGMSLTNPPIVPTNFDDANFDPFSTQVYEVAAVDALGQSGPPALVTFTPLSLVLGDVGLNGQLTRRYLDDIEVIIRNQGDTTLFNVRLDLTLKDGVETLGTRTLEPGIILPPGVQFSLDDIFSTGAGTADTRSLEMDLSVSPGGGATLHYLRTEQLPVREPPAPIEIFTEPIVLGAEASFRLRILNHGSADMQIRTSELGEATDDVVIVVSDLDANILATAGLNQLDNGVFNLATFSIADIPAGSSFFTNPIVMPIPSNAPEQIIVEAFVRETHSDLFGFTPDVVGAELTRLKFVDTGNPPYLAETTTDKLLYDQGEGVLLSGRAYDPDTLLSEPNVEVKVGIHTRGFDRFISVMTDGNGDFIADFVPIPGEAGLYTAWATHPTVVDRGSQAQFEILGLRLSPPRASVLMSKANFFPFEITLRNVGETPQSGLSFEILAGNGVMGSVDDSELQEPLEPGARVQIPITITTDPVADAANFMVLTITSAEGAAVTFDISLELLDPFPAIATAPSFVEIGLGNEDLVVRTVRIENRGFETLEGIVLAPPNNPWITLGIDPNLPPIPPGGSTDVPVIFAPNMNVAPGIYSDRFIINSTNHPPYTENLFAIVTSSQVGRAVFEVRNTEDVALPGASVWIQSLDVPSLILEQSTDELGMTTFEDLPSGNYQFRVQATGTQPSMGNFVIEPDQTNSIAVFNNVVYVTLDWTVTPVIINDQYEFKLEATFETFVPAPVLITDPLDFSIELLPGETYTGEYKLKNLGLVAVDDVVIATSAGGGMILDTLVDRIDRLGAREEITIPFRLTRPLPDSVVETRSNRAGSANRGGTPNIADVCAPLPARIQQFGDYTCRAGFRTPTGAFVRITVRIPKILTIAPAQKSLADELKLCSNDCTLCGIISSCAGAFGNLVAKAAGAACKCLTALTKIKDLDTAASAACDCISALVAALKAKGAAQNPPQDFDDSGVPDTCSCLLGYATGATTDPLACLALGGEDLKAVADVTGSAKNAFRCGREVMDCICYHIPDMCWREPFSFSGGSSEEGGPTQTSDGGGGSFTSTTPRLGTPEFDFPYPSIQNFIDCDNFPPDSVPPGEAP